MNILNLSSMAGILFCALIIGCYPLQEPKPAKITVAKIMPPPGSAITFRDSINICFSKVVTGPILSYDYYDPALQMMYLDSNFYPGIFVQMNTRYSSSNNCVILSFPQDQNNFVPPKNLVLTIARYNAFQDPETQTDFGVYEKNTATESVETGLKVHFNLISN